MNEQGHTPFEISLPEGKTYSDLDKAHEEGPEAEEALYPTEQVRIDNAESYRKEMDSVETPEQLAALQSRLVPDQNAEGQTEIDQRTGNDSTIRKSLEGRIPIKKEDFDSQDSLATLLSNNRLPKTTEPIDVDAILVEGQKYVTEGRLRAEQFAQLQESAAQRITEIQNTQMDASTNILASSTKVDQIDLTLFYTKGHLGARRLREEQVNQLQELAAQRIAKIQSEMEKQQLELMEYYKNLIYGAENTQIIEDYLFFAKRRMSDDELTQEQFNDIELAAKGTIQRLKEGF